MGNFVSIFKKQGGISLLKSYWQNGVLGYAMAQLFLTGKSVKALELLRLGVNLKLNKKIKKVFLPILDDFDNDYHELDSAPSKKVWIYWSTGLEETAPKIVKICYRRVCVLLKEREIILLSKYNYHNYIKLPDYIVEKYDKGLIEHVHFADLLRIELLAKYGGTWIDSTVYLMSDKIPSYMLDSNFFVFQKLKPGLDGNVIRLSSWFITAYSNQKFVLAQRFLIREYWKRYDKAIDYFFFHHFLSIVADYYAEDWKKIVQIPNSAPHILLLMLFDTYNQEKFDAVKAFCPIQKLSYKFDENQIAMKGTYYDVLFNGEL